jgi:lipopolysaccharide/colanic/teichoic acid biosynthesis glycosyltransferase
MVNNAENLKEKLLTKNEREGPLFKIKNDPRITKFGKFLRKSSIDELPQLFCVIAGSMSIIGPRPHLAKEVENYKPWEKRLLSVKPGIS